MNMGYYVTQDRRVVLRVVRHNERPQHVEAPIKPYFYVEEPRVTVARYYASRVGIPITVHNTDLRTIDGTVVSKVETQLPKQVGLLRRVMPKGLALEADVPFERRVRIDLDWKTSDTYNVAYFDLETATRDFDGFKEGTIIGASVVSQGVSEVYVGSESDVVKWLHNMVTEHRFELLVGYNSDAFDVPILTQKAQKLGLAFNVRFTDLYWLVRSERQKMFSSWTLEHVAKELVGLGRVNADRPVHQLTRQEIAERCLCDSELLYEIERTYGFVDTAITKAYYTYLFPDETTYASKPIDSLLLRKARELGLALPSKPENYDEEVKHSGAYVHQPPEALRVFENVLVLDVASMYPSIIMQFKVSPDKDGVLIPKVIEDLYRERLRLKELASKGDVRANVKQGALKILLNAVYGVMSNPSFRLFNVELGDRVAVYGREINSVMREACEQLGLKVVASDTDSVFVVIPKDTTEEGYYDLARYLELCIRERMGVDITVEPDKLFSRIYFPRRGGDSTAAKKKYAGLVAWRKGKGRITPTVETVGMETVRSDWPQAIKDLQKLVVSEYLTGGRVTPLVEEFVNMLRNGQVPVEQLALSKSISKAEYKVEPHHVQAAKKAEKLGYKYYVGDKVQYVYTYFGIQPLVNGNVRPEHVDVNYYLELLNNMLERTVGVRYDGTLDQYLGV